MGCGSSSVFSASSVGHALDDSSVTSFGSALSHSHTDSGGGSGAAHSHAPASTSSPRSTHAHAHAHVNAHSKGVVVAQHGGTRSPYVLSQRRAREALILQEGLAAARVIEKSAAARRGHSTHSRFRSLPNASLSQAQWDQERERDAHTKLPGARSPSRSDRRPSQSAPPHSVVPDIIGRAVARDADDSEASLSKRQLSHRHRREPSSSPRFDENAAQAAASVAARAANAAGGGGEVSRGASTTVHQRVLPSPVTRAVTATRSQHEDDTTQQTQTPALPLISARSSTRAALPPVSFAASVDGEPTAATSGAASQRNNRRTSAVHDRPRIVTRPQPPAASAPPSSAPSHSDVCAVAIDPPAANPAEPPQQQQASPSPQQSQEAPRPASPAAASSNGAIVPMDADTYAKMFPMYSDSNAEYLNYRREWEQEQLRLKAEREAAAAAARVAGRRLKSRSIYSMDQLQNRERSLSPAGSGVCSPLSGRADGAMLVAGNTALCLLIESSRPASVCTSPVPGYRLVREPQVAPLSPSLYALDKSKSSFPFPGSPNPLSPPLSQRDRCLYERRDGAASPSLYDTYSAIGHASQQQQQAPAGAPPRHSRNNSNAFQPVMPANQTTAAAAAATASNADQARSVPAPAASYSSRRIPGAVQPTSNNLTAPGTSGGVDWRGVESKLQRLAEESEAELAHSSASQSSASSTAAATTTAANATATAAANVDASSLPSKARPTLMVQVC